MAAPTPVSSLVHSSTLVTAGVYLLIRFNVIYQNSLCLKILYLVSIITILMAGGSAIFEDDMKKMVALSTLRQLGVIIIIIGSHKPLMAYYHLILHAYFKAILFMCAGYSIHSIKDYQDIRCMGIGGSIMPYIVSMILVCNLRLCGLPFIRGFYSKDIVLEYIMLQSNRGIIMTFVMLATILTIAYSVRISLLMGINSFRMESIIPIGHFDFFIFSGVFILYPFAIFGGYLIR